jgi:hypothetical protein
MLDIIGMIDQSAEASLQRFRSAIVPVEASLIGGRAASPTCTALLL